MGARSLILFLFMISTATAAESFQDCVDCPRMVAVPAGVFTMGADTERRAWKPSHRVKITQPFAIAITETTWDQYTGCVADGACREPLNDHGWGRGNRPVIKIAVSDAYAYTDWLSARTGQAYRLPSEAEWEYAARAGTTTKYSFGDQVGTDQVVCYRCLSDPDNHSTWPVGSFAPNPWGLFDVHGNVSEWTADCWRPHYRQVPGSQTPFSGDDATGSDPRSFSCRKRVTRSGDWYYKPGVATSAARQKFFGDQGSYLIGFRVVREMAPQ